MLDPTKVLEKYDNQDEMRNKFDMALCTYFVRLNLPWAIMDTEAHKDFWNIVIFPFVI